MDGLGRAELPSPGRYRRLQQRSPGPRAVFLDRDGVLLEEPGYLHQVSDMRIIDGAPQAVKRLNAAGLAVVVVTNQAGVGRGYYGWPDFEAVQQALEQELGEAWFDAVYACAYHPDGVPPFNQPDAWRKPNPGMLTDAAAQLFLNLADCWLVGDKTIDVDTARAAGLRGGILVRTGYGRQHEGLVPHGTPVVDSLPDAVLEILRYNG